VRILGERQHLRFSELFAGVTSRSEVVVTFLALLELIRLKQLTAVQPEAFGEIEIRRSVAPILAPTQVEEGSALSPASTHGENPPVSPVS
jgi:chromatin segregation and condensation protein Rec8/ScpA/Scc1 (kleisin family)